MTNGSPLLQALYDVKRHWFDPDYGSTDASFLKALEKLDLEIRLDERSKAAPVLMWETVPRGATEDTKDRPPQLVEFIVTIDAYEQMALCKQCDTGFKAETPYSSLWLRLEVHARRCMKGVSLNG